MNGRGWPADEIADLRLKPGQSEAMTAAARRLKARTAALRAGYTSGRHICDTVSRLLTDPRVQVRIAELQKATAQQGKAEAEAHAEAGWVVAELVKIARDDPRNLFHADGAPKKVHELDDEEAAALSGFEATGEAGKVVDRLKVLELLGRRFGLWQQKPAPAHNVDLFDGMSLDQVRRVRDRVGQILGGAGVDLPRSASRRRQG